MFFFLLVTRSSSSPLEFPRVRIIIVTFASGCFVIIQTVLYGKKKIFVSYLLTSIKIIYMYMSMDTSEGDWNKRYNRVNHIYFLPRCLTDIRFWRQNQLYDRQDDFSISIHYVKIFHHNLNIPHNRFDMQGVVLHMICF